MKGWMGYGVRFDGLRVLLVEDEAIIAFDLEGTLMELGCAVMPIAASVGGALDLLQAERPDVAILDMELGDGWVTPVAEQLRAADVPFAILSGHARQDITEPVLHDAPFLAKPFTTAEVTCVLLRLREKASSLRLDPHPRLSIVDALEERAS